MAKDPAFLFYPGDWLGGTMTFTRSHKGAYMDLLMAQYNSGHMDIQDIKIILGSDFETMWEQKLKSKFKIDELGKYFNEKLEYEINKRKKFTQSRRNNLESLKSNTPHMNTHMGSHMENGNINVNINKEEKGVQGEKQNSHFGNHKLFYSEENSHQLENELENNFRQHESLVSSALDTYKLVITTEDVVKMIPVFITHLKNTSSYPIEDKEAKAFFGNWFNKKLKEHVKNSNSKDRGRSSSRVTDDYRAKLAADIQSAINQATTAQS